MLQQYFANKVAEALRPVCVSRTFSLATWPSGVQFTRPSKLTLSASPSISPQLNLLHLFSAKFPRKISPLILAGNSINRNIESSITKFVHSITTFPGSIFKKYTQSNNHVWRGQSLGECNTKFPASERFAKGPRKISFHESQIPRTC